MTPGAWRVVRRRSTASEFHAQAIPEPARPEVWVHEVTHPALVLGSTQRSDHIVDVAACERVGVEVVRRRSGGGAVLLIPGEVTWVDVILPAGAPGWSNDVHRPMVWLGERLSEAFVDAGVAGIRVHAAGLIATEHSSLICFDGLGPGELTRGDAKLVGISQRRTRAAARLQCCWYSSYDPSAMTALLVDAPDPVALNPVATVDPEVALTVVDLLVRALDAAS